MAGQPSTQPIPIGAEIQTLPLVLDQTIYGGQVTAHYAADNGSFVLFPVFGISKVTLQVNGASVELADASGFLNITPASQNVVMTVSVINFFMEKAFRDAVLSAFITAVATTTDKVSTVAINLPWRARIATPTNQSVVSQDLVFFANTSVLNQDLVLDPQIFQGVKVSGLRFYVEASYRAEFAQDVFKVKLNLIGKTIVGLTNTIASTSGAVGALPPTYLIGVGGDIQGGGTGLEDIRTAFQLQVRKNASIPPNQSDWAEKMVEDLLANIQGIVNNFRVDQIADKNTVVTFLLGDQVKITAPIGELQDVENHLENQTDDQLKTDFENSLKTSSNISGSAKGAIGPISFGTSGSDAQSRDEASKQMVDATRKNMSKLDDIVKGNIPNVTALNVAQFQQFVTNAGFTGSVDFANFQDSTAATDFDPFSLANTFDTLVNTNGNPIGSILDLLHKGCILCIL